MGSYLSLISDTRPHLKVGSYVTALLNWHDLTVARGTSTQEMWFLPALLRLLWSCCLLLTAPCTYQVKEPLLSQTL